MGRVDDASRGEPPRSCLVLVCVCGDAASRPPGLPILRSRAGVQAHTAYESLPHAVEAYEEALLDSAYYAAKGTSLDAAAAAAALDGAAHAAAAAHAASHVARNDTKRDDASDLDAWRRRGVIRIRTASTHR